jgi:hypothetical protein
MSQPSPDRPDDAHLMPHAGSHLGRPRWVTVSLVLALLLLALIVVLHLTGNSVGGPGSHLP